MRKTILVTAALGVLGLNACEGTPAESPLISATVQPTRAYAGSEIAVISRSFATMPNVAILSGDDVLPITRRSGDSVFVLLPNDARGHYPLHIDIGSQPVGSVDVAGFVAHKIHNLGVWTVDVWPRGGRASIIGGSGNALLQLLPGPNTISVLVPNVAVGGSGQRMPGLTPSPGKLLLQPIAGPIDIWEMQPQPRQVGTIPTRTGYMIHQLSDSIFLDLTFNAIRTSRLRNGVLQTLFLLNQQLEPQRVVMSPRGDLTTLGYVYAPSGLPVFRNATGDTAYLVRGFSRYQDAQFSASGDTLWVMTEANDAAVVMTLNANTGAEFGRIHFPGTRPIAFGLDPDDSRLFVATHSNAELTSLHVIDTRTMKVTARVRAPTVSCCPSVLAVGSDGVFVVGLWDLLEFDYLRSPSAM